jgi:prenyl protein peptidase
MGWWPVGVLDAVRSVLLTAILFAGPLYESLIVQGSWRDLVRLKPLFELREWTTWRNIVAVGHRSFPSYG